MKKILVVDDEQSLREFLTLLLAKEGYDTASAAGVAAARAALVKNRYDLVITDLKLPDGTGMEVLDTAKQADPDAQVVVITAFGTPETAVEAMKLGAYDYIGKPFKVEHIKVTVQKALEKGALSRENRELKAHIQAAVATSGILGTSPRVQEMLKLVERIAPTGVNVLIQGESGTGKELVARRVHELSGRKGRFLPVNCSAIPEGLIESELFGHVKGSFTGAVADKPGLFEEARGGTLFLDEVGELPISLQPKLLRTLQDGRIKPVGGTREIETDVRIVAATNRDLREEVAEGRFREDLYYRLNVVQVEIPPLRERRDDVALLANFFLEKYRAAFGRRIRGFTPEALACLESYLYPGNVRELENLVERAVALETADQLTPGSLPAHVRDQEKAGAPRMDVLPPTGFDLDDFLKKAELHYIREALVATGGNKTRAADLLGMSFRSFRYRLDKLGME